MDTAQLALRITDAGAGSKDIDQLVWAALVAEPRSPDPKKVGVTPPAYSTDLTTTVVLIERLLPDWMWHLSSPRRGIPFQAVLCRDYAGRFDKGPHLVIVGMGATASLALLSALLEVLVL